MKNFKLILLLCVVLSIVSCKQNENKIVNLDNSKEEKDTSLFIVKKLINLSPDEVKELLGSPDTSFTTSDCLFLNGQVKCVIKTYAKNKYEIEFYENRVKSITVNLDKPLQFSENFLMSLDMKNQSPDFKSSSCMIWNSTGITEIKIFPGTSYFYLIVEKDFLRTYKPKSKNEMVAEWKENIKQWKKTQQRHDNEMYNTPAGRLMKKHPTWTLEDCENIINHRVWIGMDIWMVIYMRGNPNYKNVSNYGAGNQYQYGWDNYTPSYFYCGEDGIVTAYN